MDIIRNMKKGIIIGAGTYGQTYSEYLKKDYEIIGFIDDNPELLGQDVGGIKVLGNRDFLFSEVSTDISIFVPIGNNSIRVELLKKLINHGFKVPSFIHETAIIHSSVKIGNAVYILPGTNIMPSTTIGDFVMISMGVNIAHHVFVDEGCFFSQGTNIGASLFINKQAYFGIASTVMTGIKSIGENALLGAGAVIIRDVQDYAVVVGNPGKIIKYIK